MKNTIVVIPAYNEERSVGSIVRDVLKSPVITLCIVVDDGSTDRTAFAAKKAGATVLSNPFTIGAGSSIARGLGYALRKHADVVVVMDADGQHDPCYVNDLLRTMSGNTDMVIGSRYLTLTAASTSFPRRIGTRLISLLIHAAFGAVIHDPTSGFRVMNNKTAEFLKRLYTTPFPEPDTVLALIVKGFVLKETSVIMRKRTFGRSSINTLKAASLMIYIAIRILLLGLSGLIRYRNTVNR
jgi:glycosyltransferase involved in cell wall biosynthesis